MSQNTLSKASSTAKIQQKSFDVLFQLLLEFELAYNLCDSLQNDKLKLLQAKLKTLEKSLSSTNDLVN